MKDHLFTLHGWYCWIVHSLVVMGGVVTLLLALMQWNPAVQVYINLPTIERNFKTK